MDSGIIYCGIKDQGTSSYSVLLPLSIPQPLFSTQPTPCPVFIPLFLLSSSGLYLVFFIQHYAFSPPQFFSRTRHILYTFLCLVFLKHEHKKEVIIVIIRKMGVNNCLIWMFLMASLPDAVVGVSSSSYLLSLVSPSPFLRQVKTLT